MDTRNRPRLDAPPSRGLRLRLHGRRSSCALPPAIEIRGVGVLEASAFAALTRFAGDAYCVARDMRDVRRARPAIEAFARALAALDVPQRDERWTAFYVRVDELLTAAAAHLEPSLTSSTSQSLRRLELLLRDDFATIVLRGPRGLGAARMK